MKLSDRLNLTTLIMMAMNSPPKKKLNKEKSRKIGKGIAIRSMYEFLGRLIAALGVLFLLYSLMHSLDLTIIAVFFIYVGEQIINKQNK